MLTRSSDDLDDRLFYILKGNKKRPHLIPHDFVPMMKEIVAHHQGLEFLRNTPEFQQIYCKCKSNHSFLALSLVSSLPHKQTHSLSFSLTHSHSVLFLGETVIIRIMYVLSGSPSKNITLRAWKDTFFTSHLIKLDTEADVNNVCYYYCCCCAGGVVVVGVVVLWRVGLCPLLCSSLSSRTHNLLFSPLFPS